MIVAMRRNDLGSGDVGSFGVERNVV